MVENKCNRNQRLDTKKQWFFEPGALLRPCQPRRAVSWVAKGRRVGAVFGTACGDGGLGAQWSNMYPPTNSHGAAKEKRPFPRGRVVFLQGSVHFHVSWWEGKFFSPAIMEVDPSMKGLEQALGCSNHEDFGVSQNRAPPF